jgi:hypothetical protein
MATRIKVSSKLSSVGAYLAVGRDPPPAEKLNIYFLNFVDF